MDTTFVFLLAIVVVLMLLIPVYQGSKTFHKNMFYAKDVTSTGSVSSMEVFAVDDKELGPLVGIVLKGGNDDLRLSIARSDALALAGMLDTNARDAMATKSA